MSFFDMFSSKSSKDNYECMAQMEASALFGVAFGGSGPLKEWTLETLKLVQAIKMAEPFSHESQEAWERLYDHLNPYSHLFPLLKLIGEERESRTDDLFVIAKLRKQYPITRQKLMATDLIEE